MRASSPDGYDGVFGLCVVISGTVIAPDLPSAKSVIILCCLVVISLVYTKRLKNMKKG